MFAMLASYLLSRTLVPTMAKYLLRGHEQEAGHLNTTSRNPLVRMQVAFELAFERFRDRYHRDAGRCLHHRRAFLWGFVVGLRGLVRAAGALAGAGFLSQGGRRTVQAAPAGAGRHAHRRDGESLRPGRRLHPRTDSAQRNLQHHRQHRFALQRHQSLLQQLGADGPGGCRHPGHADAGPSSDRRICPRFATETGATNFPAWIFPFCRRTSSARF